MNVRAVIGAQALPGARRRKKSVGHRDRAMDEDKDNAPRALQPFPDELPTLNECRELLIRRAPEPSTERERIPLRQGTGRVLAEDIRAHEDIPAFDRATMDGFAVHSEAIKGAGPQSGVTLTRAGDATAAQFTDAPVAKTEAFGVATGSPMPPGADAVVPGEYCVTPDARAGGRGDGNSPVEGGAPPQTVTVLQALPAGANILPRGSDLQAGALAIEAGAVLHPSRVGVLAALGRTEISVYPRPLVSIITTGEELVPPEERPDPGQIRDSNTYTLAAALERDGAVVRETGIVSGALDELTPRLRQEMDRADIVLISGGSSVGHTDLTKDAVAAVHADVLFHGVKLRPGKPTLVGVRGQTTVFGLPGNPVSALAIYYVLVRPVLRKRMGRSDMLRERTVSARLRQPIRRIPDREELVRVRLHRDDEGLWAQPVPGTSGMIHSMSLADGHVLVTMDRPVYDAGNLVDVLLFD